MKIKEWDLMNLEERQGYIYVFMSLNLIEETFWEDKALLRKTGAQILNLLPTSYQFSTVQSLSRVQLFGTPWIAAHQASQSITNSWSLLKLMSIESAMPSNLLILCHRLLLLPPNPLSIRVFSNESTLHMRCPKGLVSIKYEPVFQNWRFVKNLFPHFQLRPVLSCLWTLT